MLLYFNYNQIEITFEKKLEMSLIFIQMSFWSNLKINSINAMSFEYNKNTKCKPM